MNNAGETKYNKEMIKLTKYFKQVYVNTPAKCEPRSNSKKITTN